MPQRSPAARPPTRTDGQAGGSRPRRYRLRDPRWRPGRQRARPGDQAVDARKARLYDIVRDTGAKTIRYLYDFGDDWQQVIKLERWFEDADTAGMPFLLEASGRRPPEDVGGPEGYAAFLAAISDASHPGHADALESGPAGFDPATVDQTQLERQVDALAQKWWPCSARK